MRKYFLITRKSAILSTIFIFSLFSNSCGIYSFTGASIPANAKTIRIDYIRNKAKTVQPTLSQIFSDDLKNYFISQTNLLLVEGPADIELSGDIVHYDNTPSAIQGNDKAALNRLTITINIRFVNNIDQKFSFSQSFTRYKDYDAKLSFLSVEPELIPDISKELVEDIYMKAFVNW